MGNASERSAGTRPITSSRYYTFVNAERGDAAQDTRSSTRTAAPVEPVYVDAHIIEPAAQSAWSKSTFPNASNSNVQNSKKGSARPYTSSNAEHTTTSNGQPMQGGRIVGAVQTAVGAGIMLVGVPLLILPGPGLLVIGGGAAVAVGGIKKLLGK